MKIIGLEQARSEGVKGFQLRNTARYIRDEMIPRAAGKRKDELFKAIHELKMIAEELDRE